MKELNVYSTVVGDLPKLVVSKTPLTFVPYDDAKWYRDKLIEAINIMDNHTVCSHVLDEFIESVK